MERYDRIWYIIEKINWGQLIRDLHPKQAVEEGIKRLIDEVGRRDIDEMTGELNHARMVLKAKIDGYALAKTGGVRKEGDYWSYFCPVQNTFDDGLYHTIGLGWDKYNEVWNNPEKYRDVLSLISDYSESFIDVFYGALGKLNGIILGDVVDNYKVETELPSNNTFLSSGSISEDKVKSGIDESPKRKLHGWSDDEKEILDWGNSLSSDSENNLRTGMSMDDVDQSILDDDFDLIKKLVNQEGFIGGIVTDDGEIRDLTPESFIEEIKRMLNGKH